MPFHLRFDSEDRPHCRFALSPLWELQEAVRTLGTPYRHGAHLPWLRRLRDGAAGLDLRPLRLLTPERGRGPDFLCPPPGGPATTIEDELDRVRGTAPERVRAELLRALAATPGAADTRHGRALLADPARAAADLAALLELAWKVLIAPHWPRLRALLEADIAFHAGRLADGGPERLFAELHPRLSWSETTLTVRSRHGGPPEHTLDGDELLLMPSAFVRPDVVCDVGPSWPATVAYPARGAAGLWSEPDGATPDALATLLGRGRATVLTALAEPATTTGLAQRLGLAPSSVSAHLSALRDAGLLTSNRYGHQVLYERTPLGIALASEAA
ncbi:ArsR/SmtB family transcription factor [Streptomyces sp. bgisy100]|uniref:ArsR/SmtB family transcription factor n=1 Tax=Streptomyces sp. bgisy100 TaxID=3413783 RepID=UPI003D763FD1